MRQTNKKRTTEFILLGKKLGMNQRQLETMLNSTPQKTEPIISSAQGPPMYNGGYYGTISIFDFE